MHGSDSQIDSRLPKPSEGGSRTAEQPSSCSSCRCWPLAILLAAALLATVAGWMPRRVLLPPPGDRAQALDSANRAPWTILTAQSLKSAHVPFWNPYVAPGVGLWADGLPSSLYPTVILHMFLPPGWSWTIDAFLRLLVAGGGVWVLAGRYRLAVPGRLVAAVVFMLCGFSMTRLSDPQMNVTPLLPWGIVAMLGLGGRLSTGRILLMALPLIIAILGGSPQAVVAMLLTILVVWLAEVLLQANDGPDVVATEKPLDWLSWRAYTLGSSWGLLLAVIIALAVTGVFWMPLVQYTWDVGQTGTALTRGYLEPKLGLPALLASLWPYTDISGSRAGAWMGTVPLLLALTAVVTRLQLRSTWLWLMALLATGALTAFPPRFIDQLWQLVPPTPARSPAMLAGVSLCLAMLAGIGMEEVALWLRPAPKADQMAASQRSWWRWCYRSFASWSSSAMVLTLVGLELLALGIPHNRGTSKSVHYPDTPAVSFLKTQQKSQPPFGVFDGTATLTAVGATAMRLPVAFLPMADHQPRTEAWLAAMQPSATTQPATPSELALRLASVRYILGQSDTPQEVPQALPRVFLAAAGQWVADLPTVIQGLLKPSFSPRQMVLMDRHVDPQRYSALTRTADSASGRPTVRTQIDLPGKRRYHIEGGSGGWLVLADAYAPDWHATLTVPNSNPRSKSRTIERDVMVGPAYGAFCAVPLLAGTSQVDLVCWPAGLRHGLMVSLAGVIMMVLLLGWSLLGSWNRSQPEDA